VFYVEIRVIIIIIIKSMPSVILICLGILPTIQSTMQLHFLSMALCDSVIYGLLQFHLCLCKTDTLDSSRFCFEDVVAVLTVDNILFIFVFWK